jgi:glycosyltransferase involved in cell wall biosynthesis
MAIKVETFAVCHNEERMMPYFLKHYLQYGSVTIFDNFSTDNSIKIASENGANVFQFDSGGLFREDILTHIRNICWKESKADWVIVTDIDELVYHNDLVSILENIDGTVILPRMFNMYSDVFPSTEGQIYDEVQCGTEIRSKMCLFKPSEIKEMNFEPGNHFAHPEGNFKLNFTSPIINLHFKNLSEEYVIARNAYLHSRNSEENRSNNWNWHLSVTAEDVRKDFEHYRTRLIKVV